MPACIYQMATEDGVPYPCAMYADAGQDFCPRHKKLMDEIDDLDKAIRRLMGEKKQ